METLGNFEQLLLFSVLRLGEEAHGVAIREMLEERAGRVASSGAIYTTLSRLEERALVASWMGEPTPGRAGRPRRHYRLEPAGARALMESYRTLEAIAGGQIGKLSELAAGK